MIAGNSCKFVTDVEEIRISNELVDNIIIDKFWENQKTTTTTKKQTNKQKKTTT